MKSTIAPDKSKGMARESASAPQISKESREVAFAYVGSVVPNSPKFFTEAFSPPGRMFQENLLVSLAKAGLAPSLVVSYFPTPSFPRSKRLWVGGEQVDLTENIKVRFTPFLNVTPIKQLFIGLGTFWQLLKWGWKARKSRRVIYQYNLSVPPAAFTLAAAKLMGASLVLSLNDINVPGQTLPNTALNRLDFWLHSKLIPYFDGHVVVSDAIMRDFLPGRSYLRIEGGVSQAVFDFVPQTAEKSIPAPFTIAFAGSFDPVNGIDILLQAFSQLEGNNYRLVIAGWGPQLSTVQEAAKKDRRIDFKGKLQFAELLQLYASADVLVAVRPTKSLNTEYFFPSKLMEYLASGTPVLATCTGHTEEEFGDVCYLLTEETADGLASMLRRIALVPAEVRREKGMQARRFMAANKTWDIQAQKIKTFVSTQVPTRRINPDKLAEGRDSQ